jgi:hypothetical protein
MVLFILSNAINDAKDAAAPNSKATASETANQ